MAELAAAGGMTACIEFNPYSACRTLAGARQLIQHAVGLGAARYSLGLCLDVLHLSRSGGSPDDLTPEAVDQIRLVHLCDAPPPPRGERSIDELRAESRTARLLPGQGSLWLKELLARLPSSIPLSIEAPTRADLGSPAAERARAALAATQALVNEN
jgi:sugar phosphate isomerase/epimerase